MLQNMKIINGRMITCVAGRYMFKNAEFTSCFRNTAVCHYVTKQKLCCLCQQVSHNSDC